MTQKPNGWNKVTVEWSDGAVVSSSSIESYFDDGHGYQNMGCTLANTLEGAGLDVMFVLIRAIADREFSEDESRRNGIIEICRLVADREDSK